MRSRCRNCPATALRDASGPTLGLKRTAGSFVDRQGYWHETRMKNVPGLGLRQRRRLQAMLGRYDKGIHLPI